jgi:hypothetical protein
VSQTRSCRRTHWSASVWLGSGGLWAGFLILKSLPVAGR